MAKIVKRNTMNNELQINKHKNNGKQLCVERVLNGTKGWVASIYLG